MKWCFIFYYLPGVLLPRSATIGPATVLGEGTILGDDCIISNSVIGRNCVIGKAMCGTMWSFMTMHKYDMQSFVMDVL